MKENGWVVVFLWGFQPFSHGNHHIRVYMHHVCLIQSISARKATHIKLGTCSGSTQCKLHFGTKMVSIGWSGSEWLPSERKNAHFQAFPQLAPSGIFSREITKHTFIYGGDIWFWPTLRVYVYMYDAWLWPTYDRVPCKPWMPHMRFYTSAGDHRAWTWLMASKTCATPDIYERMFNRIPANNTVHTPCVYMVLANPTHCIHMQGHLTSFPPTSSFTSADLRAISASNAHICRAI
jgi:hypothetical protein